MLTALVLIGAGCATQKTPTNESAPVVTPGTSVNSGAVESDKEHAEAAHISTLAGSRIELDNRNNFKPGEVTFSFKLYGLDGHEFGSNDLKTEHEKKMHLLVVRDDMTGFQHLHPEYADGKWLVKTTIPEQGSYQLYVDVVPEEEKPTVLRVPVTIGGQTVANNFPVPNSDMSAQDGTYRVLLTTNGNIKTNEHTTLTFAVSSNGQSVKNIDPYLGAYGHVVLLRHNDPDDFFHVHPITESKPADGKVQFEAQFPVKGRYTLYAQFNIGGTVKTFPITVDVNEAGQDSETHDTVDTTNEPKADNHGS